METVRKKRGGPNGMHGPNVAGKLAKILGWSRDWFGRNRKPWDPTAENSPIKRANGWRWCRKRRRTQPYAGPERSLQDGRENGVVTRLIRPKQKPSDCIAKNNPIDTAKQRRWCRKRRRIQRYKWPCRSVKSDRDIGVVMRSNRQNVVDWVPVRMSWCARAIKQQISHRRSEK